MKKQSFCLALAALLLGGVPASAAESAGAPAAEGSAAPVAAAENAGVLSAGALLQMLPAGVQQQARAGQPSDGQTVEGSGFTVWLGENDGACYLVSALSQETQRTTCGVFDFAAGAWRIPCAYDAVYRIPEGRYFLVDDSGEASVCYEAAADGTVDLSPLPIEGRVIGVDEEGYVTLVRYETVPSSNPDYAEVEKGSYALMALLDNRYQMVLDYIAEDVWPNPISFRNRVAVIQSGSTGKEYAGHHQVSLTGGTYGMVNRKGEWVGRHDYSSMTRLSGKGSERVVAERGGAPYWVTEDGTEIPLPAQPSALEEKCSAWAQSAVEQAESRGLVPEEMQGYYTLDILRGEFCSLLMKTYLALGKEAPALENAPTFTDCDSADVRAIAALKVISGYEDGSFRPRSRITREEAAAILGRFLALFREPDETAATPYADEAEIGSWARPQVAAVRNAGIMRGVSESRFAPKETYTIEQAISVAGRLYGLLAGQ